MKKLLLTLTTLLGIINVQAQSGYTFSYSTGATYTSLTAGTNISAGVIWDDENWAIPMGFNLNIGGTTMSDFIIFNNEFMPATDSAGSVNCFIPLSGTDWADRGLLSGTPSSPIRYQVSGTTPNRIFKLEYFNAGFSDEYTDFHTMNDSVNYQVWIYETTGVVEYHYGDSYESHSGAAYIFGGPLSGYMKNVDLDLLTVDMAYGVKNNPVAPDFDSSSTLFSLPSLNSIPPKGTVYRYTPVSGGTGIGDPALAAQFQVYPSRANTTVQVRNSNNLQGTIAIYTITGSLLQHDIPLQANNTINVSNLSPALYLLRVNTPSGTAVYRFTKE